MGTLSPTIGKAAQRCASQSFSNSPAIGYWRDRSNTPCSRSRSRASDSLRGELTVHIFGFCQTIGAKRSRGKAAHRTTTLRRGVRFLLRSSSPPSPPPGAAVPQPKDIKRHFKVKAEQRPDRNPGLQTEGSRSPLHQHLHAEEHPCSLHGRPVPPRAARGSPLHQPSTEHR